MKTKTRNTLMLTSGGLLLAALLLHVLERGEAFKDLILVISALLAGFPIAAKALRSARMKSFSIELLVTIAVIGALIIGEYSEAAIVTFLFLFGAYLEARTLEKARASLRSLLKMAPNEANVERGGIRKSILAEEVEEGDLVIIQSGGKIPVDGKIVSGHAYINEANITGESIPVRKAENDQVFSSSILDSGYLEVRAEKVGENTTFAKILELVEEVQENKAKTQRYLEQFASYYTPGILLLSVLVLVFTWDIHLTLTFLVIACPGALVISAPVSIVAGIGNAAKKGILIKGGNIMESLSKVNAMIFDKTGTLTQGKPEVSAIKAFGISEEALLQLAAEAEVASEHHLGRAIVKKAESLGLLLTHKPEEVEIIKGGGMSASIAGKRISLGTRTLLEQQGIPVAMEIEEYAQTQEEDGNTGVFVADEKKVLGVISIVDQIRETAFSAIRQLKKNGIQHMVMLTGDNPRTARRVAQQLGIDQVFAELLPEEKLEKVKGCMKKGVRMAMVGDGINDAPAIATADVGIAIGGAATEATMETADVVLMTTNLKKLAYAQQISKATIQNMKQNMFFSVGVVVLLLFGVLTGYVRLASGMFIHEISVLLVILNAVRLVRFPGYQINFRLWWRQFRASFYFPSVLNQIRREKVFKMKACSTHSLEEFQECSRC